MVSIKTKSLYGSLILLVVECFEWSTYIEDADCLRQSLLNNKWALEADLVDAEAATLRDLLNKALVRGYDESVHSIVDLGMRWILIKILS